MITDNYTETCLRASAMRRMAAAQQQQRDNAIREIGLDAVNNELADLIAKDAPRRDALSAITYDMLKARKERLGVQLAAMPKTIGEEK